jgi:hypothetical protein
MTITHVEDRDTVGRKMLPLRDEIPLVHHSDESCFVLGDDFR